LIEIARALATAPAVLLLDEPAAGLDDADTVRLGGLLQRLARAGLAVVLVEHDMSLVMSISDEIVVLDAGRRIAAGSPAVVEYASGKGEVIWWASSTPLENGSIQRAENLNLFLNSLLQRFRSPGAAERDAKLGGVSVPASCSSDLGFTGARAFDVRCSMLGVRCSLFDVSPTLNHGPRTSVVFPIVFTNMVAPAGATLF